jgi:HEAT repeat protein
MPGPRRARGRYTLVLVGAVLITATVLGVKYGFQSAGRFGFGTFRSSETDVNAHSPLALLNESLRRGDPRALAFIHEQVMPKPDAAKTALSDQEAKELIETLAGLRAGFPNLAAPGRAAAVSVASRILEKFSVDPAPAVWTEVLKPVHDLFSASLADASALPRCAALSEISRLWVWIPGRSLTPFEEQTLGEWKNALCPGVVRCLASPDENTRASAVACLGALPIDSAAAAAVAYAEDSSPNVRRQTLSSFAQRSILLTDEILLKRLYDAEPAIRELANLILKTRGLSQELISLGGLIYSPKPDQRVSVIPLLKDRTDVDPVTWLIQLSRDSVDTVRLSAVEALAAHKSPLVLRRLAEMARSDTSENVRQAARKVVPSLEETTASLPPLPGSSSLNPKAN